MASRTRRCSSGACRRNGVVLMRLALPLDLARARVEGIDHVADFVGLFRRFVIAFAHDGCMISSPESPCALHLGDVFVAVKTRVGCLNGLLLMPDVMKTVSPQTIGEDQPWPRNQSTVHLTFCSWTNSRGLRAGATPLMSCPRNPGHVSSGFGFAVAIDDVTNSVTSSRSTVRIMRSRIPHTTGKRLRAQAQGSGKTFDMYSKILREPAEP